VTPPAPLRGTLERISPALAYRDFAFLAASSTASIFSNQMAAVAIGWQVYAIRKDAFDLGLIGLAEFVPLLLLALPAGQLADRLSRKLIFLASLLLQAAVLALLVVVSLSGAHDRWPFYALAAGNGIVGAVGWPAVRSLFPNLVPSELMAGAMAIRSTGMQAAIIAGPALGGVFFSVRPELPYLVGGGIVVLALVWALRAREPAVVRTEEPAGLASVLAGLSFVWRTPVLLGAISLDLFAVLFGGAVALLPAFARSILHVGPAGLGVLRAATAVGALAAAALLTRRSLGRNAGVKLLVCVALFGGCIVAFGVSKSFALSIVALAVSGFVDMISVNIRSTTIALVTPDDVRGRVTAVEMVFISASNELGAFESGVVASLLGLVRGVVLGGVLTIAIAAAWLRLFPDLTRVDRLEELRPAAPEPVGSRA
jgi:MFS family permease